MPERRTKEVIAAYNYIAEEKLALVTLRMEPDFKKRIEAFRRLWDDEILRFCGLVDA